MFGQGSTGFNFGFGQTQQKQEEEKPHFQITEQMLISELPDDIAKEFIDVFTQIHDNTKELAQNSSNVTSCTVESDVASIKKETIDCINGSLASIAHQIDFGQAAFAESKNELSVAKSDFDNCSHFRGTPSPFIKRYVTRIHKTADELTQSLASYSSRFQSQQSNSSESGSAILNKMLTEQHQAILRCSSRVAALMEKLDKARSAMSSKLKTNIKFEQAEDSQQNLCSQKLQEAWRRFTADQKQKLYKIADETDLFGNSATAAKPAQSTGTFNFGGFGGQSAFGNKKR
ncbi:hypothetical protein TRFO_13145 [Tritrichomonas foetus]|uniref:Uncharacterized protein n=1 Tax=Tritrichomonas foetus TaxID=1144522 RepID=A0A1J4L3M5_9EUKA|nr:hypothetical protein TRFO_13145 [Tritrichomonas foetus]|eukprot:OHT16550.1 hypothetical protein TRFO_13145 [Tritrichomonas foetus]